MIFVITKIGGGFPSNGITFGTFFYDKAVVQDDLCAKTFKFNVRLNSQFHSLLKLL